MDIKTHKALVKKHHGWIENITSNEGIARFPTVYDREQFTRECAVIAEKERKAIAKYDTLLKKLGG